jgi:Raf kinase inhibitor-like YbhB/YbcL family protein
MTTRSSRSGRTIGTFWATTVAVGLLVVVGCSSSDSGSTGATPSTPVAPGASSGPTGTVPGSAVEAFTLTSAAFDPGGSIPVRHACVNQGGENGSPPLAWTGVPEGTETLVLVVHDPDAPMPGGFTHLVATIPTDVSSLDDGASLTGEGPMAAYIGPCPPSGEHHYQFTLYAFGPDVTIPAGADKAAVDAVADQALGVAELTGLFAHQG